MCWLVRESLPAALIKCCRCDFSYCWLFPIFTVIISFITFSLFGHLCFRWSITLFECWWPFHCVVFSWGFVVCCLLHIFPLTALFLSYLWRPLSSTVPSSTVIASYPALLHTMCPRYCNFNDLALAISSHSVFNLLSIDELVWCFYPQYFSPAPHLNASAVFL